MTLIGNLNVALWNVRRGLTTKQIRDTASALKRQEIEPLLVKVLNLVANMRDEDQEKIDETD